MANPNTPETPRQPQQGDANRRPDPGRPSEEERRRQQEQQGGRPGEQHDQPARKHQERPQQRE